MKPLSILGCAVAVSNNTVLVGALGNLTSHSMQARHTSTNSETTDPGIINRQIIQEENSQCPHSKKVHLGQK